VTVTRANVEAGKGILGPRLGVAYAYGRVWSPTNPRQGCDCSAAVGTELEIVTKSLDRASWAHVVSTESWPYDYNTNTPAAPGTVGPYGTIAVARLSDIPADAAMTINIMHGGGGEDSHMNCVLDGTVIESNGSHGTCTAGTGAYASTASLWTDHWYLPGPIIEDGTPVTAQPEPPDTLFADVSEWQTPVNDTYPYRTISIRSNDGTRRDLNWANYAWCCRAADDGRLTHFYVYFVWRPGVDSVGVLKSMVGAPHPKMVVEIDIESWNGEISGNQSAGLNAAFAQVAQWLGDPRRVMAYGNAGDLTNLWPARPAGMRVRVASYGSNQSFPGKIAHQYTNGKGYGGGLPEGCPPFGNCDMNSADGLTATALAELHGIDTAPPTPPGGISMADAQGITNLISGTNADGSPLIGPDGADYRRVDALADYEGPAGADGVGKYGAAGATPEAPNTSRSLLDIGGTTEAKIVTRRYVNKHGQKLDLFDMVVGIYQASGEPEVVKGPVTA
jgi:hypothetical protein